jgi:hypothetical protein
LIPAREQLVAHSSADRSSRSGHNDARHAEVSLNTLSPLLARRWPELAASAEEQLAVEAPSPAADQVRLTTAVVGRGLSELS